jgi:hypothetical protein
LEHTLTPSTSYRILQIALVFFGTLMLLLYPLAVVWPSGWAWHHGAPYQSDYLRDAGPVPLECGATS